MKKIFIFMAALGIFGASCTKDQSNVAKVSIVGTILKWETLTPLKDVVVKWSNGSSLNTVKTDKNGRYSITGVPSGVYKLIFMKTGFQSADYNCVANISVTEVSANYEQVFTVPDIRIDSLGGTLNTMVIKNNGSTTIAAANVPYIISLSQYDTPILGTTDALGNISVSNLPMYNNFNLVFNTTIDNYTYNYVNSPISLNARYSGTIPISGTKAFVTPLVILSSDILNNNGLPVKDFDRTKDITITFNMAINYSTNLEDNTDFTISLFGGTIAIDWKKFSPDRKTLTIRPLASSIKAKTEYTVVINGLTAAGDPTNSFSSTITYKTGE